MEGSNHEDFSPQAKKHKHTKDPQRYPCDECDHTSSNKTDLKRHMNSEHIGITYSCDKCDFVGTSLSGLRGHKTRVHILTNYEYYNPLNTGSGRINQQPETIKKKKGSEGGSMLGGGIPSRGGGNASRGGGNATNGGGNATSGGGIASSGVTFPSRGEVGFKRSGVAAGGGGILSREGTSQPKGQPRLFVVPVQSRMRKKRCAVPGCGDYAGTMHRFPKKPQRMEEWLQAIGLTKLPYIDARICENHFTLDSYKRDMKAELMEGQPSKKTLLDVAVPSLLLNMVEEEDLMDAVDRPCFTREYEALVSGFLKKHTDHIQGVKAHEKPGENSELVTCEHDFDHAESDLDHVKLEPDLDHVKAESDLDHVKAESDLDYVKLEPDLDHVKAESDLDYVKAESDHNHLNAESDIDHGKAESDLDQVKAEIDQDDPLSGY